MLRRRIRQRLQPSGEDALDLGANRARGPFFLWEGGGGNHRIGIDHEHGNRELLRNLGTPFASGANRVEIGDHGGGLQLLHLLRELLDRVAGDATPADAAFQEGFGQLGQPFGHEGIGAQGCPGIGRHQAETGHHRHAQLVRQRDRQIRRPVVPGALGSRYPEQDAITGCEGPVFEQLDAGILEERIDGHGHGHLSVRARLRTRQMYHTSVRAVCEIGSGGQSCHLELGGSCSAAIARNALPSLSLISSITSASRSPIAAATGRKSSRSMVMACAPRWRSGCWEL